MKIKVEVTPEEFKEMGAADAGELKEMLLEQLNDGEVGKACKPGVDWLSSFSIEVELVENKPQRQARMKP